MRFQWRPLVRRADMPAVSVRAPRGASAARRSHAHHRHVGAAQAPPRGSWALETRRGGPRRRGVPAVSPPAGPAPPRTQQRHRLCRGLRRFGRQRCGRVGAVGAPGTAAVWLQSAPPEVRLRGCRQRRHRCRWRQQPPVLPRTRRQRAAAPVFSSRTPPPHLPVKQKDEARVLATCHAV